MGLPRYNSDSNEGIELFYDGEVTAPEMEQELNEANSILENNPNPVDFIHDLQDYVHEHFPDVLADDFTVYTKACYFGWVEDVVPIQINDGEYIYCQLDLGGIDFDNNYVIFIQYIDDEWVTVPSDNWDISQDSSIQMKFYQTCPISVLLAVG